MTTKCGTNCFWTLWIICVMWPTTWWLQPKIRLMCGRNRFEHWNLGNYESFAFTSFWWKIIIAVQQGTQGQAGHLSNLNVGEKDYSASAVRSSIIRANKKFHSNTRKTDNTHDWLDPVFNVWETCSEHWIAQSRNANYIFRSIMINRAHYLAYLNEKDNELHKWPTTRAMEPNRY